MAPIPPPPGTVQRGELLVDAQTRRLWLGVDETLDPTMALLVSDILGMQDEIDALYDTLKTYIDDQLALKSNVGHKHTVSDITDFPSSVSQGGVPPLCIIIYSGPLNNLPVNFVLCDGNNGTPNLTEKFIMGFSNNYGYKSNGGSLTSGSVTTSTSGSHSHGGATVGHVLSWAEMPHHWHNILDPGHSHNVNDPGHVHSYLTRQSNNSWPGGTNFPGVWHSDQYVNTDQRGTGIWLSHAGTGVYMDGQGSNYAHTHTINAEAGHAHTVNVSNLPPYYALAYLMKLP